MPIVHRDGFGQDQHMNGYTQPISGPLPRRAANLGHGCLTAAVVFLFLSIASPASAYTPEQIVAAIHRVETGGYGEGARGDHGAARGPLQIHECAWRDSRVPGSWSDCDRLDYSIRVWMAYCRRYEPAAYARGDAQVLARLWNGGPSWAKRKAKTDGYWAKVQKQLERSKP